MQTEMRRCKECGKLFKPKGREQYCSEIHYRPCPICGEPVIAKYLSDPPRRCANCKAKSRVTIPAKPLFDILDIQSTDIKETTSNESNTKTTQPSQTSTEMSVSNPSQIEQPSDIPLGKDVRKYIGKDYRNGKGYLPNHIYEIHIEKDQYSYILTAVYDYTENKAIALKELFSSVISINGHFEKLGQSDAE